MLEAYEGMENIHFVLKANSITSGIEEDIRDYLTLHPNIKLVVIDTLQHIRGNEFVKNIYAGDVEFTNILRQISMEFDLTILALTHTNKGKHDDDISKISGSEGMAGGTDGNWVLTKSKRTDTRANLTISNRDTEAFEFALEFDKESCRWNKLTRDESVVNEKERFLHAKDWGELQTKYFELMTLFCQFALRENGEEKHWYKKILELMPKDDTDDSTTDNDLKDIP